MNIEAPLPQNLLAEQAVLGAVQYDPRALSLVADSLKESDFSGIAYYHPQIWRAMLTLYHRDDTVELAALVAQLAHQGVAEIKGRPVLAYLNSLYQYALEYAPDIEKNAHMVKDTAVRRRLRSAVERMAAIVHEEEDAAAAVEQCESLLYSVGNDMEQDDLLPLSEVMDEFLLDLDIRQREKGKLTGLATGLDDVDGMLGGLQPQEMIVLGGLPGQGKTSLLLNILYHTILKSKKHVAFFSLEMSRKDLARRLVSMDTHINSQYLRTRYLEGEQWDEIIASATQETRLAVRHTFIDQSGDSTPSKMRSKLRRHVARHGTLDAIFIDYMQLLQGDEQEGGRRGGESDIEEQSRISRGIKKLAKQFNCPVLVVASLRKIADGKRPGLSDLRGSGTIAYDCDVAMFVMRSQERDGYVILNVEKHRNGPTGDITLKFDPALTKFSGIEEGDVS